MLMRCRFSDIEMVLLIVGREETEILVHENVLFKASSVFKTAFTSRFKEGSERTIYLPDDDAALMDVLVQSLYSPASKLNGIDTTMELLHLYVLADKYDVVKIKNTICKRVLSSLHVERSLSARGKNDTTCPKFSEVEFIYENTTSTAPMRRVLVDWFVWGAGLAWYNTEECRSGLLSVPEFAVDLCAVLGKDFSKKAKARPFMNRTWVYLEEESIMDRDQIKE